MCQKKVARSPRGMSSASKNTAQRATCAKKKEPGHREGDRAPIRLCFENRPRPTGAYRRALRSRWWCLLLDTRRWSTDFTTQLAYVTWIQRTTSFATGFWRRWPLPEGPRRPGRPSCCVRHDLTNVIIITAALKLASSICRELTILPRSARGGKYSDAGKRT